MIRGILFDINGTVTDIRTDEEDAGIYRVLQNFLKYQRIRLPSDRIKSLYYEINKRQRQESNEEFPEFDVVKLFREIVENHASSAFQDLSVEKQNLLPEILAELFRAASLRRLQVYPDVFPVLNELRKDFRLAVVSDGQSLWAIPELNDVGLAGYFDPVVISSDYGFRKPDERLFQIALRKMNMTPDEVLFVGNDMFRDVYGANKAGIRNIFFRSYLDDKKITDAEPDYIIYNFSELLEAVRFFVRQTQKIPSA